jgi:hypothetical protein
VAERLEMARGAVQRQEQEHSMGNLGTFGMEDDVRVV